MDKKKIKKFLSSLKDKMSMFEILVRVKLRFKTTYFPINNKDNFLNLIMDVLIFNKNCHFVAIFKDYMIMDYKDEFLKRYYQINESQDRIPRFINFYKNYLKFFCNPTFNNFQINNIILEYNEKKAEIYYNQNLKNKEDKKDFDDGFDDEDDLNCDNISQSKFEKTIFNEIIKKQIDDISFELNNNDGNTERTIHLQPNDYIPNQSFLYSKKSNKQSLINIINAFNGKVFNGNNKKRYKPKLNSYLNFTSNKKKIDSKLMSYTSLSKKNTISISKISNIKDSIKNDKNNENQNFNKNIKKSRNTFNNNLYTLNKLNSKFKTYDILSENNKNKKDFVKTQNIENLLNKFQNNIVHKKNIYSIDSLLKKNNKKNIINSTSLNFNNSKKGKNTLINNNSLKKPNSKSNGKKIGKINTRNKKNSLNKKSLNIKIPNHHTINQNDDIIKLTLSTILLNELKLKNNHKKDNNSHNKQNQNLNNISNQINISNNQLQEVLNSKLNKKLLKNDKIEMIINTNLKNIISDKSTKLSRNKGRSIELKEDTISTSNKNSVYRSCSRLDKKLLTTTSNNVNNKSAYKSNILHKKIKKITNNNLIKSFGKNKLMDIYSKPKSINSNFNNKNINNKSSSKK